MSTAGGLYRRLVTGRTGRPRTKHTITRIPPNMLRQFRLVRVLMMAVVMVMMMPLLRKILRQHVTFATHVGTSFRLIAMQLRLRWNEWILQVILSLFRSPSSIVLERPNPRTARTRINEFGFPVATGPFVQNPRNVRTEQQTNARDTKINKNGANQLVGICRGHKISRPRRRQGHNGKINAIQGFPTFLESKNEK